MQIDLNINRAQLPKLLLQAKAEVNVEGRGTGKSADIGFTIDRLVRRMPGSVIALTGKTYGQLLTRTLPSSLKILNRIGYEKGLNYVIGRRPPDSFRNSYEPLGKFDNVISFANGTRIAMISQCEPGSGRGANTDFEIADEALLLDREQYNAEVVPTNRGNLEFFGPRSEHPVWLHHGFKYSTSMPVTKSGRWILDYADYYMKERGIRLFDVWNQVVNAQLELLDIAARHRRLPPDDTGRRAETVTEFRNQWNETVRLRRKMQPFVSDDGVLFTLSNAFDNLEFLGIDYLLQARDQLPSLVFMTEIMNLYHAKVDDAFYNIDEQRQIYYTGYDEQRLRGYAEQVQYDIDPQAVASSVYDSDCDPSLPLELSFDWGSKISVMTVSQTKNYDHAAARSISPREALTQINEFFVKPDGHQAVMINELIDKFTRYYSAHTNRTIFYYKDRYGDTRNAAVLNAQTYNQMAIDRLEAAGWRVCVEQHRGQEPPQSDRYILWGLLLQENDPQLPLFRINGDRCRFTLASMNGAKVRDYDGQLKKDKSSERPSSGVLPEEATHFSDAVDKIVWTKYGRLLHERSQPRTSFVRI